MKTKVYTVLGVFAALLMAWSGRRFVVSPIGIFWTLPFLASAVTLFTAIFVTNNSRLAFVSGIILTCLAVGGGIFSIMALVAGSGNLTGYSSIAAAVFGTMATLQAGADVPEDPE